MPLRLDSSGGGFEEGFSTLLNAKRETTQDVSGAVRDILADVAARGDAALLEYTARFDRLSLQPEGLAFGAEEIDAALKRCSRKELDALQLAADRIEVFHRRNLPLDDSFTDAAGVELGHRWTPIAAVGMYAPGGLASYPSSVLMNAIPAKVAGVPRRVIAMPAPEGKYNPLCLAAAKLAGVHEIYRIGGAQALAALAYGTNMIKAVDKITGPGNAYVAAAKRQLFGVVGIDMIAGPSEILVVADGANDPAWIAADLLSQAEHDSAAQAILITDDAGFADLVLAAIARHLQSLPRAAIARESWERHGSVILVPALDEAAALIDRIAPEHLQLAVENPRRLMAQVRNAGAVFLGRHTPEAIGDYIAGPNHVLPTARAARYASGLSVSDFMKRTTFIGCKPGALSVIGPAAIALAESEGLSAHARAIAIRGNFSGGG